MVPDNLTLASNPALLMLLGAAVLPLLPARVRGFWLPVPPAAALVVFWSLPNGSAGGIQYLGLALEPFRIDPLARTFATVFLVAALLAAVYAVWLRDLLQQAATLVYAGATIGGALAGDLVTLLVWWELAGLASAYLVWARRDGRAARAGQRYLLVQVISGVLLLGGIALWVNAGNGLAFGEIGTGSAAGWLLLFGFGMKAGFPLLYVWVTDTYPEATVLGTVVLSAFTTKLAIYALARGFAGTELLLWLGAATAVLAMVYAVLQTDVRRVMAYALVIQLGYMLTSVGAGGEAGVNGAAAHATVHILYKMLVFMALGAVLHREGTMQAGRLGGLLRAMPVSAAGFAIGAATMAASPLFAGFVSKGLLLEAVHHDSSVVYYLLLAVSAVVFTHFCLRAFQLVFLGPSGSAGSGSLGASGAGSGSLGASGAGSGGVRETRPESPVSMRVAMVGAAALCVALGLAPGLLYGLLPYPVELTAYTAGHVLEQVLVLAAGAAVFAILVALRRYPTVSRSYRVDADWLYLRALPAVAGAAIRGCLAVRALAVGLVRGPGGRLLRAAQRPLEPQGRVATTWSTGAMAWWVALVFGLVLILALVLG